MQAIRHVAAIPGRRLAENMLAVVFMLGWAAVLLSRLNEVYERLEYTQLSLMVRKLENAAVAVTGERMAADQMASLAHMVGSNPVKWLTQPPPRYRGEVSHANGASLHGHDWFFDLDTRRLVYVIGDTGLIASDAINPQHVEFEVVLQYGDRNANGVFDHGIDAPWDLAVVPVAPYHVTKPMRRW